jgi:hypothetical protein
MVEKSTYTSNSSITLKSLMPVAVKRHVYVAEDMDGIAHNLPVYHVFVFKKEIPIILFYLSKGIHFTMDYLNVSDIIKFIDTMPIIREDDKIYFGMSSKCYMEVDKYLFNKYPFVQSVVGAFLYVSSSRVSYEMLDDPKVWIKKIANPPNYEKGLSIVKYFGRLIDESTKKILRLPEYYKCDIYAVLKWMMQHFNELRLKDNCDLDSKRLRCNEYIASLLSKEFSKRLNRIISMGDKATIESMREIFKFNGDVLITKMHSSGILRFDDSVNDLNFFSKYKFTKLKWSMLVK